LGQHGRFEAQRAFEMMGVRGLYQDGWMLSTVPVRPPWEVLGKTILNPADAYKWEAEPKGSRGSSV
jgi:hypothetical protein